jgi:primosomal protein N'
MAIARVALPVAAWQLFDYWIPDGLQTAAGDIVSRAPRGRAQSGVVTAIEPTSDFLDRVQPIQSVADVRRLPAEIMELATFTGAYYQASPGMAFSLATPPLVRVRRTKRNDDTAAASDAPAIRRCGAYLTVRCSRQSMRSSPPLSTLAAAAARRDRPARRTSISPPPPTSSRKASKC